jgi:aspartyl-tRNA(Asn)/glutamyl-tRNA(Gln) amidotransferase subunit B
MTQSGDRPEQIAEREGLAQVGDETQLATWVDEVITAQSAEWQRYVGGEKKLLGVFVGAVMKKSGGRADPKKVNQLLAARASG